MKKTLCIVGIVFVAFLLTAVSIHSKKSRNASIFNDEHYYNNNDGNTNDSFTDAPDSTSDTIHTGEIEIDTNPNSITVLVNKDYGLGENYVPDDLVVPDIEYYFSYFDEKKLLRAEAATALEELVQAAKNDNLSIIGVSGYRSYNRQKYIYETNLRTKGETHTNKYSAKPGYSEHQTGLSIDVSTGSISNALVERFSETPEGIWLAENCYRFGFIIRYPEGKQSITGYSYEPWHIRYVGVELATYLTKNDLTLEEYYNYTPSTPNEEGSYDNLVEDEGYVASSPTPTKRPKPSKTATPSETPVPSETPEPTETPEPSETPKPSKTPKPTKTPKPSVGPTTPPSSTVTPSSKPTVSPTVPPVTSTTPPSSTPTVAPTTKPPVATSTPEPTKKPVEDDTSNESSTTEE